MRRVRIRHARLRLDISWRDLAAGLIQALVPADQVRCVRDLARCWPEPELVVPALSVRSGFDLLLSTVDWPPGSEVLMSGITIPQMAVIVRAHGFTPVAVDVDLQTLLIDEAAARRAVGPRTRALVYSSLFGTRPDLASMIEFGRAAGLMIIDDSAQAFSGTTESLGPADVAMYSFGLIKTATSLGGAVLLVRDEALREAMIDHQSRYPPQSRRSQLTKLLKGCLLLGLGQPGLFAIFTDLLQRAGFDYDTVVRRCSRSFRDAQLLTSIRRRPSPGLLALMRRRLSSYDSTRIERRRRAGERYAAELAGQFAILGESDPTHTYWLFPLLSADPAALVRAGRAAGFDFTTGASILTAVDHRCREATRAMDQVVYLPLDPAMAETDVRRLIKAAIEPESGCDADHCTSAAEFRVRLA